MASSVISMGVFGEFPVRIDPWQAEYGPEIGAEVEPEEADLQVVEDVEVPRKSWQPIVSKAAAPPFGRMVFVDGVRRIDARIQIARPMAICYGAFGTYAVGSVHVASGTARFGDARVERVVATGSGIAIPNPVPVMEAASYHPVASPETDPDAPLRLIQAEMRRGEERLASELAQQDDTLVITDGPLRFEESGQGNAAGYIKRISKFYISGDLGILEALPPGARTPLFMLRMKRPLGRYSWFLRIAAPVVGDSPLSGIVRVEVSVTSGFEAARDLADTMAPLLPLFAPARGRDPRAPQNLVPVGALEARLRHMMGNRELLRRHIERVIRTEARHG